jgi:hypothetical protein
MSIRLETVWLKAKDTSILQDSSHSLFTEAAGLSRMDLHGHVKLDPVFSRQVLEDLLRQTHQVSAVPLRVEAINAEESRWRGRSPVRHNYRCGCSSADLVPYYSSVLDL